jgi:bifunctional non-homologous end joining protein LigD
MLATPGPVRSATGWAFEIKLDGARAVGYTGPVGLRVLSRNDRDVSRSDPEVAALGLDPGLTLDGELVALDARGRPDFARLQQRMQLTSPPATLLAAVPVHYVVFDLLQHRGESLLELPYQQRRTRLPSWHLIRRV